MSSATKVRVRIAPSPTGSPSVGTARAALFNYLFAKKTNGVFVLRIEDTDLERSDKKYEAEIFEGLRWLGIDPDEGPEQGGQYGQYRQTERAETYKKYLDRLFDAGMAYFCFHTKEESEREMEELRNAHMPQLHVCEYRTMDPAEAENMAGINPNHIIRFKTPAGRKIIFDDLVRGEVSFDSGLLGDFAIARHRDAPLYHFAVVADDTEMKITHVVRGEDHIPNTPKHILLFEAFGAPVPQFAHLPLILGSDRSKLSKRHGALSILEYRSMGYLPEALFNFLALLGWSPGDDREVMDRREIIEKFSLERVQKSGAIFDTTKLDWMNGEYIRRKSVEELAESCKPFLADFIAATSASPKHSDILKNVGMFNGRISDEYLKKIIALEQPRLKKLSEIGERTEYFFRQPDYDKALLRWRNMDDQHIMKSLALSEKILSDLLSQDTPSVSKEHLKNTFLESRVWTSLAEKIGGIELGGGDKGRLLWPLRVALTGRKASPGPFEVMEILGPDESLARIRRAQEKLKQHD